MEYKSWFEEFRIESDDEEAVAKEKAEAVADEAKWRATGECSNDEDQIMHVYAYKCMEKELFSLGAYIEKKYPTPDKRWWLAESVYQHYGTFCLMARRPAEAIVWYLKSLEFEQPYPYPTWERLAAAYAEVGDLEQADLWIEQYTNYYREKKQRIGIHEWESFAQYYYDTKRPHLALKFLEEYAQHSKHITIDHKHLLGQVYFALGNFAKAIELFEAYLAICEEDANVYAELGLAYYNGFGNVEASERNYLKAVEFAEKNFTNHVEWVASVYDILAIIHSNECNWDQCFYYLKQCYLTKYPPEEAAPLVDMIDNLPEIENDEMGREIYQVVTAFESSYLRPTSSRIVEEKALENPEDEVKDVLKENENRSPLFNLDDLSVN